MKYVNLNAFDDLVKITYKSANIFLIHNFFNQDTIKEIKNKLKEVCNQDKLWNKLTLQETSERRTLQIENVRLFKNLNEEFRSPELLNKIKETLGWDVKTGSISIWHDTEGYNIPLHIDNENVKYAIQIYLGGNENYLGTSFGKNKTNIEDDIFMTVPYKENFGYCMKNCDDVIHGLLNKVPKDFNRYSLYSLYQ